MKGRSIFQAVLSVIIAFMFVACATALATNYSRNVGEWGQAHLKNPLLWLLDFCALYTLLLTAVLMRQQDSLGKQSALVLQLREEHHRQLEATIANTDILEQNYAETCEKLEALQTQAQEWETEKQKLREQTLYAVEAQMAAHARQLEAVNLAMQYHRAEITQLRHGVRSLQNSESEEGLFTPVSEQKALTEGDFALSSGSLVTTPNLRPSEATEVEEPITVAVVGSA